MTSGDWHLPALLASREEYQARLDLILPQAITGITATKNLAAASIAFTAMYVGAIDSARPIRPTTMLWMSDAIAARREDADRQGYYLAAVSHAGEKAVREFCTAQGIERGESWYAANSREQARDESIKTLMANGAILKRTDVPTTSSKPRYTLEPGFAALLSPELAEDALTAAISDWQSQHLTVVGRRRAALRRDPSRSTESVVINLPDGGTRTLHPGESSHILKAVVEKFAPARLKEPSVVFISQSGEKVNLVDGQALEDMGLAVDQTNLLPDCIIVDVAPRADAIWFIEAVATDGPITHERKQDLLTSATSQNIAPESCHFLTAFAARTSPTAKRALPQLAVGSHAWFADEPDNLLSWEENSMA
ncbi:BsuBI/PstI family type II restriction endonuclease [Streptomyces sp. MS1.AVA.3]|uniref:BsuBI/PstI family type II restriction endonuclease n=1 Tax=Streptomyces decoyicus TaxID=249567 RepID=UPI0030C5EFF5